MKYIPVYPVQLHTSNDRSKINIVIMVSEYGKDFTKLVTVVVNKPATFFKTIGLSVRRRSLLTIAMKHALRLGECIMLRNVRADDRRLPECRMKGRRYACAK